MIQESAKLFQGPGRLVRAYGSGPFPPRTCSLTSSKLLGTEPPLKVRKSSRVGFHPGILRQRVLHPDIQKDVERMGLSPGDDVDMTVSLPEMVDYPE